MSALCSIVSLLMSRGGMPHGRATQVTSPFRWLTDNFSTCCPATNTRENCSSSVGSTCRSSSPWPGSTFAAEMGGREPVGTWERTSGTSAPSSLHAATSNECSLSSRTRDSSRSCNRTRPDTRRLKRWESLLAQPRAMAFSSRTISTRVCPQRQCPHSTPLMLWAASRG